MSTPIWISHRGYCHKATENTQNAFDAALDLGFGHLETDLRCSADGHIVLAHDSSLARLTNNRVKRAIESCTRDELSEIRLNNGEPLLFFDQFLHLYQHCHWILDIKVESQVATLNALQDFIDNGHHQAFFNQRVRYLFWHNDIQSQWLARQPKAICMAQLPQCRRAAFSHLCQLPSLSGITPGVTYAVPTRFMGIDLMRPRLVDGYRQRQGKVLAYLPVSDVETRRALTVGVDEILTNNKILN